MIFGSVIILIFSTLLGYFLIDIRAEWKDKKAWRSTELAYEQQQQDELRLPDYIQDQVDETDQLCEVIRRQLPSWVSLPSPVRYSWDAGVPHGPHWPEYVPVGHAGHRQLAVRVLGCQGCIREHVRQQQLAEAEDRLARSEEHLKAVQREYNNAYNSYSLNYYDFGYEKSSAEQTVRKYRRELEQLRRKA